jgi:hypothetical protein
MSDWGSTNRVFAHVALVDGLAIEGELHLLSRPAYPPGPETPLEMLNRPDAFFALSLAGGGVAFFPKSRVIEIACPGEVPLFSDPDRESAAKHVDLEVVLQGGREYRGRATVELPPQRARALDFVNAPGSFFALWSDGATRYINKSHVHQIRPLD